MFVGVGCHVRPPINCYSVHGPKKMVSGFVAFFLAAENRQNQLTSFLFLRDLSTLVPRYR